MSDDPAGEIKGGEWEAINSLRAGEMDYLPSARVPHIGHALLFVSIAGLLLLLSQALVLVPLMPRGASVIAISLQHPKLLLGTEGATYLLTIAISWFVFPLFWHRSFLDGIEWGGAAALRFGAKLIPIGILAGWTVQALSNLISMPKKVPMDDFFRSTSDVWLVTFFGVLVAPLFEEICFRGFLLPAVTIAFDWLGPVLRYVVLFSGWRLRGETPEQHFFVLRESQSAGLAEGTGNMAFRSLPAILLASVMTSGLFGLLHAQQLGYSWPAVLLLATVSLMLTAVRILTRSVACSALVHGSYNLSVFLILFVVTGGYRHLERMAR